MESVFVLGVLGFFFALWVYSKYMNPDEDDDYETKHYGPISPIYICPHCQTKGFVHTKTVKRKKGVSGAKVTGALLTCGISMLATGLSRKEGLTQAHCGNCNSQWDF